MCLDSADRPRCCPSPVVDIQSNHSVSSGCLFFVDMRISLPGDPRSPPLFSIAPSWCIASSSRLWCTPDSRGLVFTCWFGGQWQVAICKSLDHWAAACVRSSPAQLDPGVDCHLQFSALGWVCAGCKEEEIGYHLWIMCARTGYHATCESFPTSYFFLPRPLSLRVRSHLRRLHRLILGQAPATSP